MSSVDPCAKCGRTLLQLRESVGVEALRGAVPLCAVPACPLVQQVTGFAPPPPPVKGREIFGPSPPSVFVGRFGYPKVKAGPLLPPGLPPNPVLDDPAALARLDISAVLALRSQLVRSKALLDVRHPLDEAKALDVSRQLAMAQRPVETEVTLRKVPKLEFSPRLDAMSAPIGPSVDVIRARVTQHVRVPRKVDAIVGDVHADAATGAWELYENGIDVGQIQRLLSVGLLGEQSRRRLVPTRWSITATDDTVGKQFIARVKEKGLLDVVERHSSVLFGNHFHVLLLPRVWSFEMIEAWQASGRWVTKVDREGYGGRSSYADEITGAYYAARLAVLEHLEARSRQAAAFVYREITDEYWAPLGVWVIREGVRAALRSAPESHESIEAGLASIGARSRSPTWAEHARLPHEARRQRRLEEFA